MAKDLEEKPGQQLDQESRQVEAGGGTGTSTIVEPAAADVSAIPLAEALPPLPPLAAAPSESSPAAGPGGGGGGEEPPATVLAGPIDVPPEPALAGRSSGTAMSDDGRQEEQEEEDKGRQEVEAETEESEAEEGEAGEAAATAGAGTSNVDAAPAPAAAESAPPAPTAAPAPDAESLSSSAPPSAAAAAAAVEALEVSQPIDRSSEEDDIGAVVTVPSVPSKAPAPPSRVAAPAQQPSAAKAPGPPGPLESPRVPPFTAGHALPAEFPCSPTDCSLAWRALGCYTCLRTLSCWLALSPFPPLALLRGLCAPQRSTLIDEVHVHLLRVLACYYKPPKLPSTSVKCQPWGLLDQTNWPVYFGWYVRARQELTWAAWGDADLLWAGRDEATEQGGLVLARELAAREWHRTSVATRVGVLEYLCGRLMDLPEVVEGLGARGAAYDMHALQRTEHPDAHADFCGVCRASGDLLICDACPRVYHHACVGEKPYGLPAVWLCPECRFPDPAYYAARVPEHYCRVAFRARSGREEENWALRILHGFVFRQVVSGAALPEPAAPQLLTPPQVYRLLEQLGPERAARWPFSQLRRPPGLFADDRGNSARQAAVAELSLQRELLHRGEEVWDPSTPEYALATILDVPLGRPVRGKLPKPPTPVATYAEYVARQRRGEEGSEPGKGEDTSRGRSKGIDVAAPVDPLLGKDEKEHEEQPPPTPPSSVAAEEEAEEEEGDAAAMEASSPTVPETRASEAAGSGRTDGSGEREEQWKEDVGRPGPRALPLASLATAVVTSRGRVVRPPASHSEFERESGFNGGVGRRGRARKKAEAAAVVPKGPGKVRGGRRKQQQEGKRRRRRRQQALPCSSSEEEEEEDDYGESEPEPEEEASEEESEEEDGAAVDDHIEFAEEGRSDGGEEEGAEEWMVKGAGRGPQGEHGGLADDPDGHVAVAAPRTYQLLLKIRGELEGEASFFNPFLYSNKYRFDAPTAARAGVLDLLRGSWRPRFASPLRPALDIDDVSIRGRVEAAAKPLPQVAHLPRFDDRGAFVHLEKLKDMLLQVESQLRGLLLGPWETGTAVVNAWGQRVYMSRSVQELGRLAALMVESAHPRAFLAGWHSVRAGGFSREPTHPGRAPEREPGPLVGATSRVPPLKRPHVAKVEGNVSVRWWRVVDEEPGGSFVLLCLLTQYQTPNQPLGRGAGPAREGAPETRGEDARP